MNKEIKTVKSIKITKYSSGIYCIIFNTRDKWVSYERVSECLFVFYEGNDEGEITREEEIVIDYDLDYSQFISTHTQNKDQVYFYLIPKSLIGATRETLKDRLIVYELSF